MTHRVSTAKSSIKARITQQSLGIPNTELVDDSEALGEGLRAETLVLRSRHSLRTCEWICKQRRATYVAVRGHREIGVKSCVILCCGIHLLKKPGSATLPAQRNRSFAPSTKCSPAQGLSIYYHLATDATHIDVFPVRVVLSTKYVSASFRRRQSHPHTGVFQAVPRSASSLCNSLLMSLCEFAAEVREASPARKKVTAVIFMVSTDIESKDSGGQTKACRESELKREEKLLLVLCLSPVFSRESKISPGTRSRQTTPLNATSDRMNLRSLQTCNRQQQQQSTYSIPSLNSASYCMSPIPLLLFC